MFKEYVKEFINDESGSEMLQFAIIIVIVVGLIGVVTTIQSMIKNRLSESADVIDEGFDEALNGSSSGSSGD